jgi:hypothetical protein
MPRRDVTLTDKIALLEQVKNQMPNTNHCQLVETPGVPESTTACIIQHQEKLWDEWTSDYGQQGTSPKKWMHEGKDPDAEETIIQWFPVVIGWGVCVSVVQC